MFGSGGLRREPYAGYHDWIETEDLARLKMQPAEFEAFFRRTGITFNVYGPEEAAEHLIPFDIVPRIISAREWSRLTRGIEQRVRAINGFLHDIYHRQGILRPGRAPVDLIARNEAFLPEMTFEDAIKLLLVSFNSTIKANLSVGMPLDAQVYPKDNFLMGRLNISVWVCNF